MTMTIPTVPSLPAGYIATAADMNNMAYACTFLLTKPMAHVTDSAGSQAIGTSFTTINFAQKDYDTDGMWSSGTPSRLTVQTPGRYKIRYSIFGIGTTNTNPIQVHAFSTTGANNPGGAGNTHTFWESYCNQNSGNGGGSGGGGVWPDFMYAGDYFTLAAESTLGTGQSTQAGTSFFSVEYVGIS